MFPPPQCEIYIRADVVGVWRRLNQTLWVFKIEDPLSFDFPLFTISPQKLISQTFPGFHTAEQTHDTHEISGIFFSDKTAIS